MTLLLSILLGIITAVVSVILLSTPRSKRKRQQPSQLKYFSPEWPEKEHDDFPPPKRERWWAGEE